MGGILSGIRQRLGNFFNRNKIGSLTWTVGNPAVYLPIDSEKAITEGYNANTAVYSIVTMASEKFGSIPRYVYKKEAETKSFRKKSYDENIVDNDLMKLLNRPNEYMSQDAFFSLIYAYRAVTGEAMIWLNRGDTSLVNEDGSFTQLDDMAHSKKPVLEMYVLPVDYVTVIPDKFNLWGISGYSLDLDGKSIPLRKVDVIHWKNSSLEFDTMGSHLRGRSPLSSGYKTLQSDNSSTDAMVRMFQNDGAKGVLFNETWNNLSGDQQKTVEGVINRKINNNDVKGAVASLQGKWGYLNLMGSIDNTLLEAKNYNWKELCFLFNTPYELFNPEIAYADKNRSQKEWVSNHIIPMCKQLDGEMNRVLLIAFGGGSFFIGCDFDDLPEMQEDLKEKATWLMQTWPLTPNEVREALGYEPIGKEFDEPFIPSGVTPLSQSLDGFNDMVNDGNGV